MAVKFFGQFLLEKGFVSRESLLAAIELQEKRNLKFGAMALAMGYITPADIEQANKAQFSRDMKLGDLLVETGKLTVSQLEEIVARQKENHLYIGEALVLAGALSSEQLQQHLGAFREDQAPYACDTIEFPAGTADGRTWEMTVDLTLKMITRILGFNFRPGKCRVVTSLGTNFTMAAMDLDGDAKARYILSVSAPVQKKVAQAILRQKSVEHEPAEVLDDAVMEFVNVVCGNVVAKASQMGMAMEINPPLTIHPPAAGLPVPEGHTALCFPIHLADGERMELYLLIPQSSCRV